MKVNIFTTIVMIQCHSFSIAAQASQAAMPPAPKNVPITHIIPTPSTSCFHIGITRNLETNEYIAAYYCNCVCCFIKSCNRSQVPLVPQQLAQAWHHIDFHKYTCERRKSNTRS